MTLSFYAILGIAYFGWGRLISLAAERPKRRQEDRSYSFLIWLGWACTLFVFQCIHFFFPLNIFSAGPVFIFGIALSVGFLVRRYRRKTETTPAASSTLKPARTIIVFIVLLMSAWIASRSMLPAKFYDSGLYYFNIVQWTNSFPIVPGLGNLHGRLAFNQSFFTYVAALNLHPLFGHGRSIANGFLLLLAFLTLFEVILPVLRRPSLAVQLHPLGWAPALFCFPMLAYWALSSPGLSSFSPDLTSSLLQVVIFVIFARAASDFAEHRTISLCYAMTLIVLATTAITVKLSNVAFCGIVIALTLIGALKNSEKRIGDAGRLCLPAVLMILVMCLRGVILSGAPLYPSTIGYVHADWSVPMNRVIEEKNWVYSWARQPLTHWSNVLGNWNWFTPWLRRLTTEITGIVYPLGVFLTLSIIIAFVAPLFSGFKSARRYLPHSIALLPILSGLAFWFATAPDPRFASALFMLLPVCAILILMTHLQNHVKSKTFAVIICVLFVAGNLNLVHWAYRNQGALAEISLDGWQPDKQVALDLKVTKSGLAIYTPVTGDQCWNSPVPCTPYFNENLRLIDPTEMSSGFKEGNK